MGRLCWRSERANIHKIKLFLVLGADPNKYFHTNPILLCPSPVEQTPLLMAAEIGNVKVASMLIDHGAIINKSNANGATPLHFAVGVCTFTMVPSLPSFKSIKNPHYSPEEILKNCITTAEFLIDNGADPNAADEFGETPLHSAAFYGHEEMVELLIERGAKVNIRNSDGFTPLHSAGFLTKNKNEKVVRILLDYGAEVDANGKLGTPLCVAAIHGLNEIVETLIAHGADVNALDTEKGNSPLHKAAGSTYGASNEGVIETVNLLISNGADVNSTNNEGETPLHKSARSGHSEVVKILIDNGADVHTLDDNGNTPLHKVGDFGSLGPKRRAQESVELLISSGVDINSTNNKGETPLHKSAHSGHNEVVKILIDNGADVHALDDNGNTPLHKVANLKNLGPKERALESVKLLISSGVDVNARNNNDETPLGLAIKNKNDKLADFFRKHGAVE